MASMAGCERTNRYNIPLNHLEYDYIQDMTDIKHLEKIVKTLRAGEEGHFPDLEAFAENRLKTLHPKSKVLWKTQRVSTPHDMDKAEWATITGDLDDWTSEMKNADVGIKDRVSINSELPPVRGKTTINTDNVGTEEKSDINEESKKGSSSSKKKRVKPREFREWDKFDIDAELAKVDGKENIEGADVSDVTKPAKTKGGKNVLRKGSKPSIPDHVDTTGLSNAEKETKATTEKEKGNEAFRATDYEEALLYYCRSLSITQNVNVFNNRAQAYLKLKSWSKALADCQAVLEREPGNVKGLLRRAVAYQGKTQYVNAKNDLQKVLSVDPDNKRAKEILKDIEKLLAEQKVKGRRMVIEESDGSDNEGDSESPVNRPDNPVHTKNSDSAVSDTATVHPNQTDGEAVNKVIDEKTHEDKTVLQSKSDKSKDIFGEKDVTVASEQKPHVINESSKPTHESKSCEPSKNDTKPAVKIEGSGNETKGGKNSKRRKKGKGSAKQQAPQQSPKNLQQAKKNTEPAATTSPESPAVSTVTSVTESILTESKPESNDTKTTPEPEPEQTESQPEISLESHPSAKPSMPVAEPVPQLPPQKELPTRVLKQKTQGNALFKVGQYGEAILHYDKGIDALLKDKVSHIVNLSLLYSNRAACKLKTGDCEGCVRDCNEALERVPGSIKPLTRRAQAYELMEKFRRAYIDFRQVLYIDSSVVVAMQGVNRCMKTLQQVDGLKWREKLPQVSMSTLTPLLPHTTTTIPSSRPSQVEPPIDTKTPASTPTKTEPVSVPTETKEELFEKHKSKGNAFVQKGDFKSAIPCYTTCIETLPNQSAPYTNRALCHLRLNHPDMVVTDCSEALKLEPDNIKALFRRAQAYKMLERYDESFHDLTCLLKQDSKNAPARREFQLVINYREQAKKARLAAEKEQMEKEQMEKEQMEKPRPTTGKQRQRMKIQEVSDSEDEDDEQLKSKPAATTEEKSKQHQGNKNKSHKKSKSAKSGTKEEAKPAKLDTKAESEPAPTESPSEEMTSEPKEDPKPKKPSETDKAKSPPKDEVPRLEKKTPYEFLQAWTALRLTKQTEPYAKLLEQIEPEEIPKVISNKLDGDMLHKIIRCVELLLDQGTAQGSPLPSLFSRSLAYLQQLTSVPRFSMVTMFMGGTEKEDLERVLLKLSAGSSCQYLQEDLQKLKKAYNI